MASEQQEVVQNLEGRTVVDASGERIGKVADVYFDEATGKPEWALVTTGLFGSQHSFVPITQASFGDDVQVPVTKDQVKDAPRLDDDGDLDEEEEALLARHYGLSYSETRSETGLPVGGAPEVDEQPASTDDAMTRSEEELEVGTVRRPRELVRLRKHLVTEQVQMTVPVEREEVVVEREPITDANVDQALRGPELTESEHEVVLEEEEPVVNKQVVPKERVRLDTTTTVEEREVDETLTKEQVEVERGATS